MTKTYKLMAADGSTITSTVPGTLGGNRKAKIYGLLTCTAANAALAKGYVTQANETSHAEILICRWG